jgi:hypothetical protein
LNGEDYRIEIVAMINALFMDYAVEFFGKVMNAKLKNLAVTIDWYRKEFLDPNLPPGELLINAGLNKKTISNMYNTANRKVVIDASLEHFELLHKTISELIERGEGIDITITLKLRGVSVDLTMSESLIVINTLAVKRAALRGGAWSTAGKQVEKALMLTLCKLYSVPDDHYTKTGLTDEKREVDFFLIDQGGKRYQCEVKLMGKGNPESADAALARTTDIFVADKLSDLTKGQFTGRGIHWVELRSEGGYQRFGNILAQIGVPHTPFSGNLDAVLPEIFASIF